MILDELLVVLIAAGSSLAVAVIGLVALRLLRRRSTVASVTVVALVSVGAVLAGALGTARAMFLSGHDFSVLLTIVLVAGSVGVATAVVLGRAVVAGSRALGLSAAGLAEGGAFALTETHIALDLAELLARVDGADIGVLVERIADAKRLDAAKQA